MASQVEQLHIVLVPLLNESHLIPYINMAKLLAQRGPSVTIVTTPLNASKFQKIVCTNETSNSHLKIEFLALRFPCQEVGLPEGCESINSLPSPKLMPTFYKACELLLEPLEKWVEEKIESWAKPSCIISDYAFPWTEKLAIKFNIPRFIFHGRSCFAFVCVRKITTSNVLELIKSDSEPFLVPDIPHRIEFTRAQLPPTSRKTQGDNSGDQVKKYSDFTLSADGILVNSFEELESDYLNEYRNIMKKKIWCIGPVSNTGKDKILGSINEQENCLMKWLEERTKLGSVVYASFGGLSRFSSSQLKELAIGLESSNCPFIWVIRKDNYYSTRRFEEWLEEENFEERVKDRGLIFRGWAPQVPILNHPAVGGFLTHCGWNSTLDAFSAGLPMITWPMFAEQFQNEKFIVEVLKIGVSVGAEEIVENYERENDEEDDDQKSLRGFIKREAIKKAIEDLMDERNEGEERRKRARQVREMTNGAVEGGGSSFLNISFFLQHISELLASKHS